MSIFKKLQCALVVSVVLAGLGLTVAEAGAAIRGTAEFINQPGSPFVCRTDEGYGRWSSCDLGG